ncbi:MDGA2 protein, partial [Dicaeum eximium]|nr:MDGA2 protein [Dicaeum eximium]
MYIETSRPRLEGEKARLVSPVFSVAPKNPYGATNTAYCFSFYYHMYGQHIGERKPIPLGKNSWKNFLFLEEKHGKSASSSESLV